MAEYDMGLDFAAAEKAVEESRRPVAAADYTLQIAQEPELRHNKESGRPGLIWTLTIVGHPEYSGKKLFYYTALPWTDPKTGEFVTSGVNFLIDLCKGFGCPWTGGKLNTAQMLGKTSKARTTIEADNKGNPQARIELFY